MRWPTSLCDRVSFWNEMQPNRMGHCGLGVWQNTRSGLKFPALPLTFFSTLQQCSLWHWLQATPTPITHCLSLETAAAKAPQRIDNCCFSKARISGARISFSVLCGELHSSIYKIVIFTLSESQQNWDSQKCIPNSKLLSTDTTLNSHTSSVLTVKTKDGQ